MAGLSKNHFYYGAILAAIIEYNPDTALVLLEQTDARNVYKIQTNTSQECTIFFKYASGKNNHWQFNFSADDRRFLEEEYKKKTPTFIYLLCAKEKLRKSEIVVLNYDEYKQIPNNSYLYVTLADRGHYFSVSNLQIRRNRLKQTFDDLIKETVEKSKGYYCPKCGEKITKLNL
ncbi:MAG TPA: hypothetical protein IAA60_07660 [Candidatus Ornithomonoglobus intestinigallinarum]|uniref:Uncharacterized protein n=1 Tax=Candidatus Ornithomonoglobus intestinigallinarum TaxID=2840894 RepID=A0A9D1H363_9FIRM|nr:hypothetical protein [Candidatus Ornithomonoglobus intestinigallinarum]